MSRTVRIDYQCISIECQSICELASSQLCKLNHMLEEIEKGASRLVNAQSIALKNEILEMRSQLQEQINRVAESAKQNARKGVVYTDFDFDDTHRGARDPIKEAETLKHMVNHMCTTRLAEVEALYQTLLGQKLKEHSAEMYDLAFGVVNMNGTFMQQVSQIEDKLLQQYVYMEWLQDRKADFSVLRQRGELAMKKATGHLLEDQREEQLSEIRNEMKTSGVAPEAIERVLKSDGNGNIQEQISSIREQATEEIIGEQKRKKALKIIKESIKKLGFLIPKGGTKIQRDTDEVVLIAQRPSGEKAEFRISLNGKFIYHFGGYEGQACEKDIAPLLADLEEVYGIQITSQEEIWRNPDKLSTQHYQTADVNHRKG